MTMTLSIDGTASVAATSSQRPGSSTNSASLGDQNLPMEQSEEDERTSRCGSTETYDSVLVDCVPLNRFCSGCRRWCEDEHW
jgi:hypothetical protein